MADVTTRYGFPFQEAADPPDGAALGQDLAEAVETALATVDDARVATQAELDALELSGPTVRVCMLQQQSGQALTDGSDTTLTFGASSEVFDTDGWHSTSVNTSRITPTKAGTYRVIARGTIAFNVQLMASHVSVLKNGTVYDATGNIKHYNNTAATTTAPGISNTAATAGELVTYVAMNGTTDYLEMSVLAISNTNNTSRTTNAATSGRSTFIVEYVGP